MKEKKTPGLAGCWLETRCQLLTFAAGAFLGGPEALGGGSATDAGLAAGFSFFSAPPAFFPPASSTLSADSFIY